MPHSLMVRQLPDGLCIEVGDRGTGLGLALVREIIEAHDGRMTLHNRDGGGLCVALFF